MSVPGLALNPPNENSAASNFAIALTGDDAAVRQQRLLVVPNPFNVSVIYRPYIAFVSAVKDIIPAGFEDDMEPFGEFLNDFVVKVYLPQLEEKVTSLLQSAISGTPLPARCRTSSLTRNCRARRISGGRVVA